MAQVVQLGRTLLSPFTSVASWYNRTAEKAPFTVGFITTGLKTSAADLFAQKVVERRDHVDWQRNAVWTSFGFIYLGAFQYYLYNNLFSRVCAPLTRRIGHLRTAPFKVFLDQGIHHPAIYFPFFFGLKSVMHGQPLSSAVDKYNTEIWDSCKALWSVWVPAQLINFAFVPRHLRIPYVAAVSFGWTVIFSVMQSKFDAALSQAKRLPAIQHGPLATAAAAAVSAGALPVPLRVAPAPPALELCAAPVAQPATPIVAAAVAERPARTARVVERA